VCLTSRISAVETFEPGTGRMVLWSSSFSAMGSLKTSVGATLLVWLGSAAGAADAAGAPSGAAGFDLAGLSALLPETVGFDLGACPMVGAGATTSSEVLRHQSNPRRMRVDFHRLESNTWPISANLVKRRDAQSGEATWRL